MSKHTQCVSTFVNAIREMGGSIEVSPCAVSGGTISIFIKGSANFDAALSRARELLRYVPGGYAWGTDGIGYVANKQSNIVELHKGVTKSVANEFVKNSFVVVV